MGRDRQASSEGHADAYNSDMSFSPISALSPLDGRYAGRLAPLRPLMSEQGYMHRRVQVEISWFIALSDAGFAQFKPLSPGARTYLMGLVKNFSEADALLSEAAALLSAADGFRGAWTLGSSTTRLA